MLKWVLSGANEQDIEEAIAATFPGTEPKPLIATVIARITADAEYDPAIVKGFCFQASRDLYRRMVEIGDFTGALRALKAMSDFAK